MKYGMSAKQSFGTMFLFVVIGIAFEIVTMLGVGGQPFGWLDFGALFLYSAAMYPAQVLMTLDISGMVQTSPYKKQIQTGAMSFASLCGNLAALVILLLVRGLGAYIAPERAIQIWGTFPLIGIMGLGLSIMGALMYKFYILSIVVLIVIFGTAGTLGSFQGGMEMENSAGFLNSMSPSMAMVFCVIMILLGNAIQYLVVRALYKRPFSKGAFGNAVGKKFV